MTWLSKVGTVLLKIVGIATGIMPLITPALPTKAASEVTTGVDKLQGIVNVVVTAEQMFANAGVAKSGSAKLAAATPFVAQIVQSIESISGKKPQNAALFSDACTRLTSAVADILNSFGD